MQPLIIVGTGIAAVNGIFSLTAIGLASIALSSAQKTGKMSGGLCNKSSQGPKQAKRKMHKVRREQHKQNMDPRSEFAATTKYVPEPAHVEHYNPKSFDHSMFHVPEGMEAIAEHADRRLERDFHIRGGVGSEVMADRDMSEFYGNENAVAPIGHREEFMKFLYKEEIEAAADSDPYAVEIKTK